MSVAEKFIVPKIFEQDIQRATRILREAGCSEIFLFGSLASGTVRAGSDLDLAVRGCPPGQFFHVLGELLLALDHSVDLVDLDKPDLFTAHLQREGELVRIA